MFQVDLVSVIEIAFIVLTLKLILGRWHPPLQESLQSIIAIIIGSGVGYFINPTKDGLIIAVVVSAIAFYGKTILSEFTDLKNDLEDELKDLDVNIKNKK